MQILKAHPLFFFHFFPNKVSVTLVISRLGRTGPRARPPVTKADAFGHVTASQNSRSWAKENALVIVWTARCVLSRDALEVSQLYLIYLMFN